MAGFVGAVDRCPGTDYNKTLFTSLLHDEQHQGARRRFSRRRGPGVTGNNISFGRGYCDCWPFSLDSIYAVVCRVGTGCKRKNLSATSAYI